MVPVRIHTYDPTPFQQLTGASVGPYRLEQLIDVDDLGPIFQGRSVANNAAYRVRLLTAVNDLAPGERDAYFQRFERQAAHIALLRHPHILPLLDYGHDHGVPYLVSPFLPLRSLTTRLAQSGPLDLVATGRYLDQIASALEYAHGQTTLHRDLSTDLIYLQLDGQLVVADFGVRKMIELAGGDNHHDPLRFHLDACAPEYLLGEHIDTPIDVYALGTTLYRILTGHPVYEGASAEEIATDHAKGPIPPLGAWRGGLPSRLDSLLVETLAKDPTKRPSQPGTVANRYHDIVSPNSAARVPFIVGGASAGRMAGSVTATGLATIGPNGISAQSSSQMGRTATISAPGAFGEASLASAPQRRDPSRGPFSFWRIALLTIVLLALVVGGLYVLQPFGIGSPAPHPSGEVTFSDGSDIPTGRSSVFTISAHSLPSLSGNDRYVVWLLNTQTESVLELGTLKRDGDTQRLSSSISVSGAPGVDVLGAGNTIEVTLEHDLVTVPVGRVVLSASFPPHTLIHLRHILVAFPTPPGQIGLVVGVLQQTQLLDQHADALQKANAASDQPGVLCEAQAMVNIIEGAQGANARVLSRACASRLTLPQGDGYGLLSVYNAAAANGEPTNSYLTNASEHASLAATQPDATPAVRTHVQGVVVSIGNIQTWVTIANSDLAAMLRNPGDTSKIPEVVTMANNAYHGNDANGDKQISPVRGEGGAITAYLQSQLMATLELASA